MSLLTHSKIYFGTVVDDTNYNLDFDEGGSELTAVLEIGSYTLEQLADEISRALNEAGALTYTVTVNRTTRVFTISAGSNFTLRIASGSHLGTTAFGLAGFTGANVTGDDSYTGNAAVGSVFTTQFILQSYVGSEDSQAATYGTVNKSASGKVEVVSFGTESFVEFNVKYATAIAMAGDVIRNSATGVSDLQALMQYLITKGPCEFMPDEDVPATFQNLLLESTADDSKGLKYKLREMYGQGLPGFFETGLLKFRVVED